MATISAAIPGYVLPGEAREFSRLSRSAEPSTRKKDQ
jgi:hypothetical protein